jgi:hypothetical protein
MSWDLTMLLMHLCALAGAVMLYRHAPCWMQKIVVGLLFVSMLVFSGAYAAALFDWHWHWMVTRAAYAIEHIAVLLYVFRLIYRDHVQWTSSAPSRSS